MAHMLNIQGLEEEENLLHPFFPPFKLAGREGLSFLHQFPASQGEMQAPFLLLPGWSPFSLYLVWRLTQGMGLQNCDLLLLRHKEELVPERCIGEPRVSLSISVSCSTIGEAKQRDCGHCCAVRVIETNGIVVFVICRLLVAGVKTKAR